LTALFFISSATGRLIPAKDHSSVQINVAEVDSNGIMTGAHIPYALCGYIRAAGQADDSLNRLNTQDGFLKKQVSTGGRKLYNIIVFCLVFGALLSSTLVNGSRLMILCFLLLFVTK
jgi:small subunit ribosomal protein S21e